VIVSAHDSAAATALRQAAAERSDARAVRIQHSDGGFVSGEARAMLRGLADARPVPPGRRVHATQQGLHGAPTLVSNVETFAQVAVLLRMGPTRYRDTGVHVEPGTTLLTVGGAVRNPGVVEIPLGTPLQIELTAAGASDTRAVVVGGYHGSWIAPIGEIQLSRQGLHHAGATLGAGVVYALDSSTCLLGELAQVTNWLAAQSAKQCGPCTFGLPALAADVLSIWHGGRAGVEAALRHARAIDGRGACTHPDGTARFVTSGIHLLHDEIDEHLHRGGCGHPVRGLLPIGGRR